MLEPATFPGEVWDGLSDNTQRINRHTDAPPTSQDWDRIVAEVIAAQETILGGAGLVDKMEWKGTWVDSTAYSVGDVVYNSSDFIWYVCVADDTGNTPGDPGSAMWEALTAPITGLPAITGIMMPSDGHHVLSVSGGVSQWTSLNIALADTDNSRLKNYVLDPDLATPVFHGTAMTLYRVTPVAATFDLATGNGVTDNVVVTASLTGTDWNGYTFTVEETANAATPIVVTYDSGNKTYTAAVIDDNPTLVSDIIAAWTDAQDDFTFDYEAEDEYAPGAMAPAQLTLITADGVDGGVFVRRAVTNNSAFNATVIGLANLGFSEDSANAGDEIQVQYQGDMTFTANQAANAFANATLEDGLLVPGMPYYLDDELFADAPGTPTGYLTPVGHCISTTEFRIQLGLPTAVPVS